MHSSESKGFRTGTSDLPLHYGSAPRWLFERMKNLSSEMIQVIVSEYGSAEFVSRLSDPFWFQAFGCVLGFDWHSSGLTTTVCGAVKEAVRGLESDLDIYVAGGKGGRSRKTPGEIEHWGERLGFDPSPLVYASRMSAKVDSAAVQDGYQLYHHLFVFTGAGLWSVIQQGMNTENRFARRYHWQSDGLDTFVCEPHRAICCDSSGETLNMVASESEAARETSAGISCEKPEKVVSDIKKAQSLSLPGRHEVLVSDVNPDRLRSILLATYEEQPEDFEKMLGMKGVGPKTVRALALLSELVYGNAPSRRDPVRFSFAHGGKDGHPYPVDRSTYDGSIAFLESALKQARIGRPEKLEAFRRLQSMA